jgi:peptide/nickel transport system permease protein
MSESLLDPVVSRLPSSHERTETVDPGRRGHPIAAFFLRRPGLVLAGLVIVVALLAAVFPTLLADQDPLRGVPADKLQPPELEHLFGTDQLGRDLFSRVVHGSALSLKATVIAVALASSVGGLIGLLAGFVGGWLDQALMRVVDVLLSIPQLLLSLALITALGYGTVKIAIAVGVAIVANFARLMRAEVLRVKHAVYVEAAHSLGARWYTVLGRHVLPNAFGPVLVLATLEFGVAILSVSALSFLGYGAPAPAPEWGSLISDGRAYLGTSWWLTTMPGLTVAATVVSLNRISRALDGEWTARR